MIYSLTVLMILLRKINPDPSGSATRKTRTNLSRGNTDTFTNEKTTFTSEKRIFLLVNAFFSSSIRIASEEAVLSW